MAEWRGRPIQSEDDGDKGSAAWKYNDTQILTGDIFGSDGDGGIRYQNVTVPKGSTINSASMGFRMNMTTFADHVTRLKVHGIDEDNTADFSSDPLGRAKTTANVDWDLSGPFDVEDEASPPNVTAIIQEIVNRAGWGSGNSLGILVLEDGSTSDTFIGWYPWDDNPNKAPELVINYTAPPTTTTSTTSTSTSTSTTNTSSSSSSSSTTTMVPDPNYAQGIMRITKEGKDVIDSNYLDDYFLDSNYPLLKVHDSGSFTTSIIGLEDIPHTLGYIPYAIVFSQYIEDAGFGGVNITSEYYQHDWFLTGAAYYSYGYTKIYDDELKIVIENINTPRPGTIDGFYYIFKEAVI